MLTDKQIRTYFKNIFGFRIRHTDLYRTALTHKSMHVSTNIGTKDNNERLEFLGDAVLGTVVADFLCHKYPTESEGVLTQMRSKMVNRARLNELARRLGLHQMIVTNGSVSASNINGNAFEAVVGAIYRDCGYKKTAKIIINNIFSIHYDIDSIFEEDKDFKSRLLIWAQQYKHEVVFSHESVIDDGQELFRVFLELDGERISEGVNTSVKRAEQRAAEIAIMKISE